MVSWRVYAALAFGIICIAFSALFVKWAAIPGPASAFYRVCFAGVVLAPWWLARRKPALSRGVLMVTVLGGIFFALDLLVWNVSLLQTSAANATLLGNTSTLWVGLGAAVLFHERMAQAFWLGLALALAGMVLIISKDLSQQIGQVGNGDLLALVAGLFYAAYLLTTQRVRAQLDTLSFMTISTLVSMALLLIFCLGTGVELSGYSQQSWLALAGLGLISHLAGWLAINYALGYLPASLTAISLLAQPVLTALLSIPLVDEPLSTPQISGGLLVLGGIALVHRRSKPATQEAQHV